MTITVCIVDDNKDIRSALEQIIIMSDGYRLLGSFSSAEEAIEKIPALSPQVVLMDINLGGMSGIECVRQLKPMHPDILYMMCTVYEEDEKIFEALSAGANGYILKKAHPSKIIEGINEVINGGAPMTASVAKRVLELFQKNRGHKIENTYRLTERETEVLSDLVKGLSYKMIAANHHLSVFTVNAHVRKIYEKLQVHSVAEAVSKAIQQHIV